MGPVRFATTADGVRVAYTTHGAGPPLLLVRGWITHLELLYADSAFRQFVDRLAQVFTVVRFDARGNGLSDRRPPGPIDVEAMTRDIEAVVDALALDQLVLWGSSFGGPAAISYAARHPEMVLRLVLDGTFASGDALAPPDKRQPFLSMLELARSQPHALFSSLSYLTDPEPADSHRRRIERMRRSIDAETVVELYTSIYEIDVEALLPSVTAPALVVHRRGSRAIPFRLGRQLAAGLPDAQLVGLDGDAHNLWEGDTEEALSVLAAFLGFEPPEPTEVTLAEPVPLARAPGGGPVAVVFTDIVGSTALTDRVGDSAAQEQVRTHNSIVRAAIAEHGGREVKHTGDGIMASFTTVSGAVAAAVAIQIGLAAAPSAPQVRIGVNAGEPLSEDDDLYGAVVQVAARTCAAAGPGQVVVTNVVRDLAAGKGFAFRDLGERPLRGVQEPVRLWEVGWTAR